MLVLSRKKLESIQIGEDIVVRVVRTGRNSVQLGIEAPRGVRILRGEIGDGSWPMPVTIEAGSIEAGNCPHTDFGIAKISVGNLEQAVVVLDDQ